MLVKSRRTRDEDLAIYLWSLITVLKMSNASLEKCKTYEDKIKKQPHEFVF